MNLVEGVLKEIDRCQELLKAYEELGPAGRFGHAAVSVSIKRAKEAIGCGADAVGMLII